MTQHSDMKHFTRGGQITLHNIRMATQIIDKVVLLAGIIFVLVTGLVAWQNTSDYERYVLGEYLWAKTLPIFDPNVTTHFIEPSGRKIRALYTDVADSPKVQNSVRYTTKKILYAIIAGLLSAMVTIAGLSYWLKKRGEQQSTTKQLRGDEIADNKTVNKLIRQSKKISDISLAGLSMPGNFEVRHLLVHGTIGSGKSVLIKQLLDQIRARGDRAIIYDKGCDFIRTYYQENTDVILNPLDERTSSWHLWNECRDFADFDSLAAALIPMPQHIDNPYWITGARTVFSATATRMKNDPDKHMLKLIRLLLSADLAQMETLLKGTEAELFVSRKIEKTTATIKSVLASYAKTLKYVKDEDNPFSIRQWIQEDTKNNWLFISSLADKHETLKPLITLWLDIAVHSLMSLPPSESRRIWIILDELPTLNRLPYLIPALAEARKFGGCLVAGTQSISQLRETYGIHGAEGISGLCNSKWFFRSPSFDTANWVSKELGQAELEEVKEGISYGESAMRSGISIAKQQVQRQLVSPSDIMRLPDLESYVRLAGGYPITKMHLAFQARMAHTTHFIPRKIDEEAFYEVDQLIEQADQPLTTHEITHITKENTIEIDT